MRGRDEFYWLEAQTEEGHFVSGRKDLLLTQSEFSETLSQLIPMYRRDPWVADEFINDYKPLRGARELLTTGHQEALQRERASFLRQLQSVAAVGVSALGFLALRAEIPMGAVAGYAAAIAAAVVYKALRASAELKDARAILRTANGETD
jgi:hypothetical protein